MYKKVYRENLINNGLSVKQFDVVDIYLYNTNCLHELIHRSGKYTRPIIELINV